MRLKNRRLLRRDYKEQREKTGQRRLSAIRLGRRQLEESKRPADTDSSESRWEELQREVPE